MLAALRLTRLRAGTIAQERNYASFYRRSKTQREEWRRGIQFKSTAGKNGRKRKEEKEKEQARKARTEELKPFGYGLAMVQKGQPSLAEKVLPLLRREERLEIQWAMQPTKIASPWLFHLRIIPIFGFESILSPEYGEYSDFPLMTFYPAALRLLHDLRALHVTIPPSSLFERAAVSGNDFLLWMQYYPPYSYDHALFPLLIPYLRKSPILPEALSELALLLASKGYLAFCVRHLLPRIFKYAPPDFSEDPFELQRLYFTAVRHLVAAGHGVEAVSLFPDPTAESANDIASAIPLRTYDMLLAKPFQRQEPFDGYHRRIEWIKHVVDTKIAQWKQAREGEQSGEPFQAKATSKPCIDWSSLPRALRTLARALLSSDPTHFPSTADLVRFYTHYIYLRASSPTRINALTLLFTRTTRLSVRSGTESASYRAISHLLFAHMVLLFRLASTSYGSAYSQGFKDAGLSETQSLPPIGRPAHRALLRLFHTFFHLQGVPRHHVLEAYSTPEAHFYISTLSSLPTSITFVPLTQPSDKIQRIRRRTTFFPHLFPTSVAYLASTPRALGLLWDELVAYASTNVEKVEEESEKSAENELEQVKRDVQTKLYSDEPPSTTKVEGEFSASNRSIQSHLPIIAECFTPFIVKLMHATYHSRRKPQFALQSPIHSPTHILRTLLSLRLSPTIYHYTEMARWWAWNGEEGQVWVVLERLEGGIKSEDRAGEKEIESGREREKDHRLLRALTNETETEDVSAVNGSESTPLSSPSPRTDTDLPTPDLPLYVSLMRAFLTSPKYRGVRSVLPSYVHRPSDSRSLLNSTTSRFGREWLLRELMLSDGNGKNYDQKEESKSAETRRFFRKAVADWRNLAHLKQRK
ncbi:hypothetical protein BDP27DRAFT_1338527 [Rhodocollybia butyracea]|uniref:Uncharacterized protein n=1 Tax=Rhodocollybia butyracea TaxID=206335 RepID=A0A9P5U0C9_9AGAR|nr:hypothetical protein BDP27DRAFT_1338527 [Rhodocollybia butyracea]